MSQDLDFTDVITMLYNRPPQERERSTLVIDMQARRILDSGIGIHARRSGKTNMRMMFYSYALGKVREEAAESADIEWELERALCPYSGPIILSKQEFIEKRVKAAVDEFHREIASTGYHL